MNGNPEFLIHFVAFIYELDSGNINYAKGVCIRNKLTAKDFQRCLLDTKKMIAIAKDIEKYTYQKNKDFKPYEDFFEPVSLPVKEHLRIPLDLEVLFIDTEDKIKQLDNLIGQETIGVDSEWKP